MEHLKDYKKEYNALSSKKNLSGEKALEAVKQNGVTLRYVNEQTEEICLEAVKQDGYALRYVNEQTEEICLEAVKQNGVALRYVNEHFFKDNNKYITLNGKQVSKETIEIALKEYFT